MSQYSVIDIGLDWKKFLIVVKQIAQHEIELKIVLFQTFAHMK